MCILRNFALKNPMISLTFNIIFYIKFKIY